MVYFVVWLQHTSSHWANICHWIREALNEQWSWFRFDVLLASIYGIQRPRNEWQYESDTTRAPSNSQRIVFRQSLMQARNKRSSALYFRHPCWARTQLKSNNQLARYDPSEDRRHEHIKWQSTVWTACACSPIAICGHFMYTAWKHFQRRRQRQSSNFSLLQESDLLSLLIGFCGFCNRSVEMTRLPPMCPPFVVLSLPPVCDLSSSLSSSLFSHRRGWSKADAIDAV